MTLILEIILAAVITAAVLTTFWAIRGAALTPVRAGENIHLTLRITASGDGESLEQTVEGLIWLRDNGTLTADIAIIDGGLTAEGRKRAELLSARYDLDFEDK